MIVAPISESIVMKKKWVAFAALAAGFLFTMGCVVADVWWHWAILGAGAWTLQEVCGISLPI